MTIAKNHGRRRVGHEESNAAVPQHELALERTDRFLCRGARLAGPWGAYCFPVHGSYVDTLWWSYICILGLWVVCCDPYKKAFSAEVHRAHFGHIDAVWEHTYAHIHIYLPIYTYMYPYIYPKTPKHTQTHAYTPPHTPWTCVLAFTPSQPTHPQPKTHKNAPIHVHMLPASAAMDAV